MKNYKLPVLIFILQIFILGSITILTYWVVFNTFKTFYLMDILFSIGMVCLFAFFWYRGLTIPYRIIVKNDNSIKFRSNIKEVEIGLKEIKSINYTPPKGEALGVVTITSPKGKLILIDIGQFHEFISKYLKNKKSIN